MKTGKPLSRKTAIHHLSFISDVFSYAVKMDMLSENPCRKVTVPKGEKKEKEIYTIEEIEQLFRLLETAPLKYRTFFTLAIYSGFRRGELLGLEWKDIDWRTNVISVKPNIELFCKAWRLHRYYKNKEIPAFLKIPACRDGFAQSVQIRTG